ncbi:unnamed protein product [Somion occarium]|uniref:GH16 domain-containing protein n=1 Tax=Somion occarium TaxID=3059160 RepID=A0ABP1CJM7_9APHY
MNSLLSLALTTLIALSVLSSASALMPSTRHAHIGVALSILSFALPSRSSLLDKRLNNLETGVNGTTFVWTIQDTYAGPTFFDRFDFYTGPDPTNGLVNYTDHDFAVAQGLAYVTPDDNKVVMKGDNTTWLPDGVNRNSVRLSSKTQYNTGLFILDLDQAPWGCAVWPAWWTLGNGQWPWHGEIDIIEGVHDNEHNQVTWHTGPNCTLTPTSQFTGTIASRTDGSPNLICDGTKPPSAGCGITEWSRASYGPTFDAQGGGVFAMKWDDEGIAVWNFYRAAVPKDIQSGQPSPSSWGQPVAVLLPDNCNIAENFIDHSIIFDITFCGDWAGNSYASSGCPGTCPDRLKDPSNFDTASWSINSMKVYRKQILNGRVTSGASTHTRPIYEMKLTSLAWLTTIFALCFSLLF